MIQDPSKIRACGPWVYLRSIDPGDPYTLDAQGSGLYYPSGAGHQRIASGRGLVISVGRGCYVRDSDLPDVNKVQGYRDGEFAEMPREVVPGVVVAYRGYLEGANQIHQWELQDYCFIHMTSLYGIWEGLELEEKDGKLFEKGTGVYDGPFFKIPAFSVHGPVHVGLDLAKK